VPLNARFMSALSPPFSAIQALWVVDPRRLDGREKAGSGRAIPVYNSSGFRTRAGTLARTCAPHEDELI
jgi:hypothetical protein